MAFDHNYKTSLLTLLSPEQLKSLGWTESVADDERLIDEPEFHQDDPDQALLEDFANEIGMDQDAGRSDGLDDATDDMDEEADVE